MDRTLRQQQIGELLDEQRIDNSGRDSAMAQHVLLDARRVHDVRIKIDEGLAVWKIKRRIGVDLTPDEHVFRREGDLLVAVAHVSAHRFHDSVFRQIDLRIQIRNAELAAAAAARGHFDDTERRSRVGKKNRVAFDWMFDVEAGL